MIATVDQIMHGRPRALPKHWWDELCCFIARSGDEWLELPEGETQAIRCPRLKCSLRYWLVGDVMVWELCDTAPNGRALRRWESGSGLFADALVESLQALYRHRLTVNGRPASFASCKA
jgi:hypothetical protein